jgi:hypothetical protein
LPLYLALIATAFVSSGWLQLLTCVAGMLAMFMLAVHVTRLEKRQAVTLGFWAHAGLGAFLLPFMLGGILLGTTVASRLHNSLSSELRVWWFVYFCVLAVVGIYLGALLAYGILIFFLSWLAPGSPLLTLENVERPTADTARVRSAIYDRSPYCRVASSPASNLSTDRSMSNPIAVAPNLSVNTDALWTALRPRTGSPVTFVR